MKKIYQNAIVIISILFFKILVWYIFQSQAIDLSNYICENLRFVPKGKQDLFNGLSKGIKVFKVSCIIIDVLSDLLILISLKFVFKDFILKNFICSYLIVSFILLVFILLIF
ncbi:hypothetical protein B4N84_10905 [Flavobacterium sp. IR1]|nr:hypothetical protein B4N84_10905 [Flavobacterium sp. IR1]